MWLIAPGKATAKLNSHPNLLPWCPTWAMKPLRNQGVVVQGTGWGWLGSYLLTMYFYKSQMQTGLLKWSPCIPLILSIVKDLTPEKHKGLHKIILYKLGTSLKETMFNPNVFCFSSFHHDGFLQLSTQPDTLLPSSSSLHRTSPAINHPPWLDAFLHLYFFTVFSIIGCGNERRCYHRDLGISDKSADQGDNQGVQRR